jgi:hypothetical protein
VVTPGGFLPGFRPRAQLGKPASEALWSHHRQLIVIEGEFDPTTPAYEFLSYHSAAGSGCLPTVAVIGPSTGWPRSVKTASLTSSQANNPSTPSP